MPTIASRRPHRPVLGFLLLAALGATLPAPAGGAEARPMALVLMDEHGVENFRKHNNFSLNTNSGFTVVNCAHGAAPRTDRPAFSGRVGRFLTRFISLNIAHATLSKSEQICEMSE